MTRKKSSGWSECKKTQCAPGCKWLRPLSIDTPDVVLQISAWERRPFDKSHATYTSSRTTSSSGTYFGRHLRDSFIGLLNSYFWPHGISYHYYVWLKYVTSVLDEEEEAVARSGCLSIRTVLQDLMLNWKISPNLQRPTFYDLSNWRRPAITHIKKGGINLRATWCWWRILFKYVVYDIAHFAWLTVSDRHIRNESRRTTVNTDFF